jgi:RNA polymerase sigma-70 factor (ECF subfamily)
VQDASADFDIMTRIRSGDHDALRELYDRYGRLSFAIAYRMLGEASAAEEVVQDAFLSVWKRSSTFNGGVTSNVRGWLLTIVRNRAIDQTRRSSRPDERTVPVEDVESRLSVPDVWADVEHREITRVVRQALDDLPEEQHRVIDLAYFEGLSQSAIAERLDVPLGTVKGRFRMGFKKLAVTLEAQRMELGITQSREL